MPRDEEADVKWVAEKLDASATVRIAIYLLGVVFAAALVVWQVRSLAAGQEEIRRDMKLLTDPVNGLVVRFLTMKTDLDARVREAEREHQAFRDSDRDHELRLRAMESARRYGMRGGGS